MSDGSEFRGWGDDGELVCIPGWRSRAYTLLGWLENDAALDRESLAEVFEYGLPVKVRHGWARFWREGEHPDMPDGGVTMHRWPGYRRVPATWVYVH